MQYGINKKENNCLPLLAVLHVCAWEKMNFHLQLLWRTTSFQVVVRQWPVTLALKVTKQWVCVDAHHARSVAEHRAIAGGAQQQLPWQGLWAVVRATSVKPLSIQIRKRLKTIQQRANCTDQNTTLPIRDIVQSTQYKVQRKWRLGPTVLMHDLKTTKPLKEVTRHHHPHEQWS